MKISVMLKTTDFRGDHSADVVRAFEPEPHETIEHLVCRLLGTKCICPDYTSHVDKP